MLSHSMCGVPRSVILHNDELEALYLDIKEKSVNFMLLGVADTMQFIIVLQIKTKKGKRKIY